MGRQERTALLMLHSTTVWQKGISKMVKPGAKPGANHVVMLEQSRPSRRGTSPCGRARRKGLSPDFPWSLPGHACKPQGAENLCRGARCDGKTRPCTFVALAPGTGSSRLAFGSASLVNLMGEASSHVLDFDTQAMPTSLATTNRLMKRLVSRRSGVKKTQAPQVL